MNTLRKTVVSVFILSLLAVGTIVFAEGSDTSAAEAPILNITEPELIPEADTEAETDTNADTSTEAEKDADTSTETAGDDTIAIFEPDEGTSEVIVDPSAEETTTGKTSPDTGVNDVSAIGGIGLLALAGVIIAKRKN